MSNVKLFESKKVRSYFDADKASWYFSIIDVIEILTGSSIPKRYWSDLKKKLLKEGSQLYEKIVQLKFPSSDDQNLVQIILILKIRLVFVYQFSEQKNISVLNVP